VDPVTHKPITEAGLAIAAQQRPEVGKQFPPDLLERGLQFAAHSFSRTYWVGFALVLATFIPIAFLPRRRERSHLLDDQDQTETAPVVVH